jgi:pyruvate formate lyase activating enzyme
MEKDLTGMVLNIQRMSTEDGPGLRTTVFFKGCPLTCAWCHNPESILFSQQIEYFENKCIGCGYCEKTCDNDAVKFAQNGRIYNSERCKKCMACVQICPANAIEIKGISWTIKDLYAELIKDQAYFGKNGGVTFSGGESLCQIDFVSQLAKMLSLQNIHVTVDTCGYIPLKSIEKIFKYTSLFLYDIKIMDSAQHLKHTGQPNEKILSNLFALAKKLDGCDDKKLWIRTPLIPNATDSEQNIRAISAFISNNLLDVLDRWELCAFNNLCTSKYERFGEKWAYADVEKLEQSKMENLRLIAVNNNAILEKKTFVTGNAKLDQSV